MTKFPSLVRKVVEQRFGGPDHARAHNCVPCHSTSGQGRCTVPTFGGAGICSGVGSLEQVSPSPYVKGGGGAQAPETSYVHGEFGTGWLGLGDNCGLP